MPSIYENGVVCIKNIYVCAKMRVANYWKILYRVVPFSVADGRISQNCKCAPRCGDLKHCKTASSCTCGPGLIRSKGEFWNFRQCADFGSFFLQAGCSRLRVGANQGLVQQDVWWSSSDELPKHITQDVRVTPSDTTTLLPLHRLEQLPQACFVTRLQELSTFSCDSQYLAIRCYTCVIAFPIVCLQTSIDKLRFYIMSDKYIPGGSKIEITAPNGNGTQKWNLLRCSGNLFSHRFHDCLWQLLPRGFIFTCAFFSTDTGLANTTTCYVPAWVVCPSTVLITNVATCCMRCTL